MTMPDSKLISINSGSSSVKFSVFGFSGIKKNVILSNIDRVLLCQKKNIYGSVFKRNKKLFAFKAFNFT